MNLLLWGEEERYTPASVSPFCMKKQHLTILFAVLILAACDGQVPGDSTSDASASSSLSQSAASSERVIRETKNVSYSGTIKPLGISIFMEGTHRLSLQDGRFILLESDSIDLNGYVDEQVDVLGSIRPTVESDAMIMRVESISLQDDETSESSSSSVDASQAQGDVSSSGSPIVVEVSSARSEPLMVAENESDDRQGTGSSAPSTSSESADFLAHQKKMAGETFTPEQWTQEYCSAHIGFCVPVHRNWWYKSFGALSLHYWHLEMSAGPIEELHEGPLVVELDGESLQALDIEEGSIHTDGERVTGYRSWTNGRHFKIYADVSLRDAVEYITKNLRAEE